MANVDYLISEVQLPGGTTVYSIADESARAGLAVVETTLSLKADKATKITDNFDLSTDHTTAEMQEELGLEDLHYITIGSNKLQVKGVEVWDALRSTVALNITTSTINRSISIGGKDVEIKSGSGDVQVKGALAWNAIDSSTALNITTGTLPGGLLVGGKEVAVKLGNGNIQVGNTTVWNAQSSTTALTITVGTSNGSIKVGSQDVAVKGLEGAAYVDTTIFAAGDKNTGSVTFTPSGAISVGTGTNNYTPSGNIYGNLSISTSTVELSYGTYATASSPTFYGATTTANHTFNPGSISTSTVITPKGHLTDAALNTATATTITGYTAGSAASYTRGEFTQGSLPSWTGTVTNGVLQFSWSAGSLPTHAADTFTPNTPTSITTANMNVATSIKTQPTFVGDNTTVNIAANVTGMSIVSHEIIPSGTISNPTISTVLNKTTVVTGVSGTGTGLQFSGTGVELKFTGNAIAHSHSQTPAD